MPPHKGEGRTEHVASPLNQGYSFFAMPRARAAPMLALRSQTQIQTGGIA